MQSQQLQLVNVNQLTKNNAAMHISAQSIWLFLKADANISDSRVAVGLYRDDLTHYLIKQILN